MSVSENVPIHQQDVQCSGKCPENWFTGLFCLPSAACLLVVRVRRNILIVEIQLNIIMWFMQKCFNITAVQGHYKVIILRSVCGDANAFCPFLRLRRRNGRSRYDPYTQLTRPKKILKSWITSV